MNDHSAAGSHLDSRFCGNIIKDRVDPDAIRQQLLSQFHSSVHIGIHQGMHQEVHAVGNGRYAIT